MYCGTSLEKVEIPVYAFSCPVCEGMLEPQAGDGWDVHICDRCVGLWMTLPMMERLEEVWAESKVERKIESDGPRLDTSEASPDPMVLEEGFEYRRCPECDVIMNRKRYKLSSVVLDECWKHGSWFDASEFTKVLSYLEGGGVRRAEAARKWHADNYKSQSAGHSPFYMHRDTRPRMGFFHPYYNP